MLTPRQWKLYRYLKERGDEWTTQLDIACALSDYYDTKFDITKFHDSKARLQITMDIRALNDSETIQKIIMSSSKGVKIANRNEFNTYIGREINAAVRRLMRAKRKAEKGNRDGQMRIVLGKERDHLQEKEMQKIKWLYEEGL